ncbi:LysR family transcriptional regulator [Thiohalophilus thiocyanatoxydans]|uniref:DNA-binding transcriptional LysR family regulator n=1 Tax=Thiohalophilus thiocyanatoxydans TaxID=381308 RepID=A0A4R8IN06_9GAMM|nr:LysR family transcriptional regulator [Thiohalophilus thiocyanatoxydans]TDY00490.1 DNA-binding transcriptional LysR family regulator [Thiohalophilus thiocyanatoxydans]
MRPPHISLDQWRVFQAIVDHGGYAQAAAALHRSQSSVSYAIKQLQMQLGVSLLEVRGRKAQLTGAGEALLGRARQLLAEAVALEELAHHLEQGWEAAIRLVVDAAFPSALLLDALQAFAPQDRGTRVLLEEVVLSGAQDALEQGQADLIIGAELPSASLADPLLEIEFVAVAHPDHPLHRLERKLKMADLEREMQVVVKDSGQQSPRDFGWLGAEHRWTVSSIDTAVTTIHHGLGYGWLPRHQIQAELQKGQLLPLPLTSGQIYRTHLYLAFGQEHPGPATQLLSDLIRRQVSLW